MKRLPVKIIIALLVLALIVVAILVISHHRCGEGEWLSPNDFIEVRYETPLEEVSQLIEKEPCRETSNYVEYSLADGAVMRLKTDGDVILDMSIFDRKGREYTMGWSLAESEEYIYDEPSMPLVRGSYQKYDRELNVNDFSKIDVGMIQQEVEEIVGKPSAWAGSGIVRPAYELSDSTWVHLWPDWQQDTLYVGGIHIEDSAGRIYRYQ